MERQTAPVRARAETPSSRDLARLEESFKVFTETTRELESSYRKLTRRASRIDLELRRTNEELTSKVAELEQLTSHRTGILDALPNGVIVLDAARSVTCINPAAERILGGPASELVGRSAEALVGPGGHRLLLGEGDRDETGRAAAEREIVTLDGASRHLSYNVAALPDGHELQVLTDLTVVTRLREQVGRLDTLAALGEMAAGVAHEIRNPLHGIDGFAGLLERAVSGEAADGVVTRYADNIRRGVREVNAIVTNLLTFAAPERLRRTPVRLAPLLTELTRDLQHLAGDGRKLVLSLGGAEGGGDAVFGDDVKLRIVFTNLIKNGLESIDGEGRVEVALDVQPEKCRAVVRVTDTGGGLPDTIRDRMFRPFTTTKPQGTGLGLAIADKFVALHDGDIGFRDTPRGTSFTVSLPLMQAEESA